MKKGVRHEHVMHPVFQKTADVKARKLEIREPPFPVSHSVGYRSFNLINFQRDGERRHLLFMKRWTCHIRPYRKVSAALHLRITRNTFISTITIYTTMKRENLREDVI